MNHTFIKFCTLIFSLALTHSAMSQCNIFEVAADPTECFDDGTFDVVINFDFENVGNEGFTIQGNGVNYGNFSYDNLPVVLEGLVGNGTTPYEFVVIDNQLTACQNWAELGVIDCTGGECDIFELVVEQTECDDMGNFVAVINFGYENVGNEGFTVTGNGGNYGNFSYDNLPIEIGPLSGDGTTQYEFVVTDAQLPDCHAGFEMGIVNCLGNNCDIFDLAVDPIECNPDGTYSLAVNFQFENPGNEFFDVYNGDNFIGFFSLDELPITIESFPASGNDYDHITVCINDNPDCCESLEFMALSCTGGDCEIWDVIAEAHECDDSNHFLVDIDFNFNNVGNSGYTVHGNGTNYGTFSYDEPYITVGPLLGDGTTVYEFIITDVNHPDCGGVATLGPIDCEGGDCEIWDLVVETGECFDDNTYHIWVDFNYANAPNSLFNVFNDAGIIGTYALADLPVMIENFPSNGNPDQGLLVCINDTAGCCEDIGFENPCFNDNECEIWDVIAEAHECDDSNHFLVDIDFNFNNVGDAGYTVHGNGTDYGTFSYDEPYITVGPLLGDGTTVYEFIITDVNHPDCGGVATLGPIDCEGGDCEIWDLVVETGECFDDNTYHLWIDFNYANAPNSLFDVSNDAGIIGTYALADLPIMIENYPSNGFPDQGLLVCINDTAGCCEDIGFDNPCFNSNECEIWDVIAEAHECDDEGNFLVDIDFNFEGVGNEGFSVVGNGANYGSFSYDEPFVTVGPVTGNGTVYEFIVVDNQFGDCSAYASLGPIFCDEACHIYNLVVETSECDDEGMFYVAITFDFQNEGDEGFSILGNGNNYGSYGYDAGVIELGPFEGNGTTAYEFMVIDNQFDDCWDIVELEPIDCDGTGDCSITEMVVETVECNPDGTYSLWLDFDYDNSPNEFFDVWTGDVFIGFFELSNLPVFIESFPTNGGNFDGLTVCINDTPDCCNGIEFEALDCEIANPVWPGDANSDNIADHFDLLNIGLAFNAEGPARAIQGIEWNAVAAPEWEQFFLDDTNFKHADCNGNHIINGGDAEAIAINFGETHGIVAPFEGIEGTEVNPPLFIDLPNPDDIVMGEPWEAPIILGNEDLQIGDIYGIAFTLVFNPDFVLPDAIEIEYQDGWMGTPGVNLISIDKTLADEGKVKMAITKTDHNNVSGFGAIAKFIGIIDNIAGKEEIYIEIEDVRAIMHNEIEIPIFTPIEVIEVVVSTVEPHDHNTVQVFPNPAKSYLYIQNEKQLAVESVEIRTADGKIIDTLLPNSNVLSFEHYAAGIYFLKIKIGDRFYFEKVVKQ